LNYTPEETLFMVEAYTAEPSRETVEKLAVKLEKSVKSIIGKLSREGVYQRAAYKSKSGDDPVTKMELVNNVAENLRIEIDDLFGLDKSPKAALKALELATGSLKWKER
jgi:hypothetical protein